MGTPRPSNTCHRQRTIESLPTHVGLLRPSANRCDSWTLVTPSNREHLTPHRCRAKARWCSADDAAAVPDPDKRWRRYAALTCRGWARCPMARGHLLHHRPPTPFDRLNDSQCKTADQKCQPRNSCGEQRVFPCVTHTPSDHTRDHMQRVPAPDSTIAADCQIETN